MQKYYQNIFDTEKFLSDMHLPTTINYTNLLKQVKTEDSLRQAVIKLLRRKTEAKYYLKPLLQNLNLV